MVRVASPTASVVLARFAERLRARFGDRLAEVVLFGSHARGEAHEESDVDVLVAVEGLTHAERLEVIDLAYDINASADDWGGLSPLVRSTADLRELRASGRRIWRDIEVDGVRL